MNFLFFLANVLESIVLYSTDKMLVRTDKFVRPVLFSCYDIRIEDWMRDPDIVSHPFP